MKKEAIGNIQICDSESLKGNLAKQYEAVVILSDTIRTEQLPKDTRLPLLIFYKPAPAEKWSDRMQQELCSFILSKSQKGNVLICSDSGDSRAVAAVIRVMVKLGFTKKDATRIIKERTGFEPKKEIMDSLPETDNRSMITVLKETLGGNKAIDATIFHLKKIGFTDKELTNIKKE